MSFSAVKEANVSPTMIAVFIPVDLKDRYRILQAKE